MTATLQTCKNCGAEEYDLICSVCGAEYCMWCGAGNMHGNGACCPEGDHCDCQRLATTYSTFTVPCLLSACFPLVAVMIDLVDSNMLDFRPHHEFALQLTAIADSALVGAPAPLAWILARQSSREISRLLGRRYHLKRFQI